MAAASALFRAFAALACLAASATIEAAVPVAEVIPAPQLRAYVARTTDGLVSHPAFADPAAKTVVVRRDGPGEVEVHVLLNDVLVAQAGAATLIVGGRVEGGRETAPNERRGGTITGGRSRALHPGDVAWIPAGIPHQLIVRKGGSFTYVVVKTDRAARP